MADPLIVLILVAANGGTEPATSSMTASARQALGASAVLLLEERPSLPSDSEAVDLAQRLRANALVEVDWIESPTKYALVHVRLAQGPGWADRRIDFVLGDPPIECGRTIGFAAASMITRLSAPQAVADRPASEAPPIESQAAPSPVSSATPTSAPSSPLAPTPAASQAPGVEAAPRPQRGSAPAAPAAARRAIEVVAVGAAPPLGGGASLSAFGRVSASFAGQLSVGMRIGQVPSTQETLAFWSLQLGGGATFFAIRSSASRPVEVDLRADVFGTDLVVARGNATQQRWVPEARLEIEGTWFLWPPSIGVVGAAGVEATIGTTDVAVGNDIVAVLHPFRSIGSLGIRVRF